MEKRIRKANGGEILRYGRNINMDIGNNLTETTIVPKSIVAHVMKFGLHYVKSAGIKLLNKQRMNSKTLN